MKKKKSTPQLTWIHDSQQSDWIKLNSKILDAHGCTLCQPFRWAHRCAQRSTFSVQHVKHHGTNQMDTNRWVFAIFYSIQNYVFICWIVQCQFRDFFSLPHYFFVLSSSIQKARSFFKSMYIFAPWKLLVINHYQKSFNWYVSTSDPFDTPELCFVFMHCRLYIVRLLSLVRQYVYFIECTIDSTKKWAR